MVSRGMLTLCAAINSVHWLLTSFLRKKNCFAYDAKTRVVTAQLMSATKIVGHPIRTFKPLAIFRACISCFVSDLGRNLRHAFSLGLNNDLFLHLCIKEGADQLRSYRAADQRFCVRFIEHISRHCECMNRNFQSAA